MLVTKAYEYGMEALAVLASKPRGTVVSMIEMCEEVNSLDTANKFLAKILQRLTMGGIVKSHRGRLGGFSLARPARSITLWEVMRLADELDLSLSNGNGTRVDKNIRGWTEDVLFKELSRRTLADWMLTKT